MPLAPDSTLPHLPVRDPGGAAEDLAALAARGPALLYVFKADCESSALGARALARLADLPGLAVAAIAQDDPDTARAFAAEHGLGPRVTLRLDAPPWTASDALLVRSTPTWILVAGGGRVVAVEEGWSRDAANALAARAAALAGASAVEVSFPADGPAFRPG